MEVAIKLCTICFPASYYRCISILNMCVACFSVIVCVCGGGEGPTTGMDSPSSHRDDTWRLRYTRRRQGQISPVHAWSTPRMSPEDIGHAGSPGCPPEIFHRQHGSTFAAYGRELGGVPQCFWVAPTRCAGPSRGRHYRLPAKDAVGTM